MKVSATLLFSLAVAGASVILDDPNAGQQRFDRSSVENEGLRNPFYSTLFNTHLNSHKTITESRDYICLICKKSYKTKAHLDRHIKSSWKCIEQLQ